MLKEKLNFLIKNGHIHFFNIDKWNFIYSRDRNQTYQIGNNIYKNLTDDKELSEAESHELNELLHQINVDVKPIIHMYSLHVLNGYSPQAQTQYIKQKIFTHFKSEVVFYELENDIGERMNWSFIDSFKGINKNDLGFFLEENSLPNTVANQKTRIQENVKIYHNISLLLQEEISEWNKIKGQFRFEYSPSREDDISNLLVNKSSFINLYIRNSASSKSFLGFLLTMLNNDLGINRNIYNFFSIANILISKLVFTRTIDEFNNNVITNASNSVCESCWCRNICWATKSFQFFNIDLFNVSDFKTECNSIKSLVEHIILKLRILESDKVNKVDQPIHFDGGEIKLVN